MGKVITSSVKRFPGTVTLAYPFTYPQIIEWDKAITALMELPDEEERVPYDIQSILWDGIRVLAESWNIQDFDLNKTPSTPQIPILDLLLWLVTEIGKIVNEEDDPNV